MKGTEGPTSIVKYDTLTKLFPNSGKIKHECASKILRTFSLYV